MGMDIDLHVHTIASDGRDTPAQVVRNAAEAKLSAIAITDHDTLDGLAEAESEAKKCGIELIRGCELSVKSERGEVHILGLWIPHKAQKLENALQILREHRAMRNIEIVDKLRAIGVDISYDDVLQIACGNNATSADSSSPKNSIGRPHIAAVLLQKGYVSSITEAFSRYIGNNCQAYGSKKLFEVEEIMELLRDVKATICLAHPGLIRCTPSWLEGYILYLRGLGLHGLEVYHSTHSDNVTYRLLSLAKKYDLCISGGSDYHGAAKPNIFLGCGKGNLCLGYDILDKLKAQRQELGYPV